MAILTDPEEIQLLKHSGAILARTMRMVSEMITSGMSAQQLDETAEQIIREQGAVPSFKGYGSKQPFPATICISVNDEVVHGIPSASKIFQQGDVIGIDCGVNYQGYFTDMAMTVGLGVISSRAKELLAVTSRALRQGIASAIMGNHIADISTAIQSEIDEKKFGIVRELVGHGVGRSVHEEPRIPNFWPWKNNTKDRGAKIVEGMVLAIEPMITAGSWEIRTGDDGWSISTKDGSCSAHFEHTVLVTTQGPCIITSEIWEKC